MTDTALPQQQRYTAVAIALHWVIALAVIGMIALGWTMENVESGRFGLIQLHKSIGITILALTAARIAWRLMNPPPPEPPMPGWQRAGALFVHVGFYVLLVVMPLTGWIMASASDDAPTRWFDLADARLPVLPGLAPGTRDTIEDTFEQVHGSLAWVMIGLLVLHVAGALKHQIADRDGLIARMAPGLFGRTAGPPDNGHGAVWTAGAAALVLAIAILPNLSSSAAPPAAGGGSAAGAGEGPAFPPDVASPAPFWTVDPAQSSIKFRFTYVDRPYEGSFQEWDATIQFDPEKPEDARIRVVIPTASITTPEPDFNDALPQGDWFDVANHPEAVFEVRQGVFKDSETEYEATGLLRVKDAAPYPVRLPFTLEIDGDTARMHGETTLQRLALDIGGDMATAEASGEDQWAGDEVVVVIDVVATRQ